MNSKEVWLTVRQTDVLIDNDEVIFDGQSSVDTDDQLNIYRFVDNNEVFTEIYLNDDEYLIKRTGEYRLNIHLTNEHSKMLVTNEIGTLEFECKLDSYTVTSNEQAIQYTVLNDGEIVGRYKLIIAWKESNE